MRFPHTPTGGAVPHDAPTTAPAAADPPSAMVVGVDDGTLSGRAVVVRVSDGVELGAAVPCTTGSAEEATT